MTYAQKSGMADATVVATLGHGLFGLGPNPFRRAALYGVALSA